MHHPGSHVCMHAHYPRCPLSRRARRSHEHRASSMGHTTRRCLRSHSNRATRSHTSTCSTTHLRTTPAGVSSLRPWSTRHCDTEHHSQRAPHGPGMISVSSTDKHVEDSPGKPTSPALRSPRITATEPDYGGAQQASGGHTWTVIPHTCRTQPRDCARQPLAPPRRTFAHPAPCEAGRWPHAALHAEQRAQTPRAAAPHSHKQRPHHPRAR